MPPRGFRPEGEIPRRHPSSSRVYIEKYLQLNFVVSIPEKNLDLDICAICWIRDFMESLGFDDVSIVHARKYEMVRMT